MLRQSFRKFYLSTVFIILFLLIPGILSAKDIREKLTVPEEGRTQILELSDGSSLRGKIIEIGNDVIKFDTEMGVMIIAIDKIIDISEVSESAIKGGKIWFPNPNDTRLFFSQNGRLMEKGEGYFSLWYLFFPSVNLGLTDNFTMGVGMSIFPGLNFSDEQFIFFTPKVGLNVGGKIDLAVSALVIRLPDFNDDDDAGNNDEDDLVNFDEPEFIGTLNLLGTVGSSDHSFTAGIGYGYAGNEWADKPYVVIGGDTRIARKVSLLAESWLLPGVKAPLIAYGARFFGEGLAVDVAFLTAFSDDGIFPGIPFVGFAYNF